MSAENASTGKSRVSTAGDNFKIPSTPLKLARPSGLPRPSPSPGSGRTTPTRAMSRETLNVASTRPDDWIVGDRCYVNGAKPGKVAFLGETRFAAGEWAGVVLDESTGKNDGSVNGVRYFQCPAKHGVFCKINKLERHYTGGSANETALTSAGNSSQANIELSKPISSTPEKKEAQLPPDQLDISAVAAAIGDELGDANSPASPSSSGAGEFLRSSTPEAAVPASGPGTQSNLKVGDRVVVSGNKTGTLRYYGVTAFKEGVWAGVELDQPLGKNDGSVDGRRYFTCKPRYGLFAPASKVVRAISPTAPRLPSMNASYAALTNSRTSLTGVAPKKLPPAPRQTLTSTMRIQRASQSRMGSQESLNSINSSIHSSASATRRRAAAADRAGSVGASHAAALSSPVYATLQESLKEKEEHILQLLRERDIERAEMARAAQMADQAQQELADTKADAERTIGEYSLRFEHLERTLEQSEKDCKRMNDHYEEEKKKCEDLQFRIEEEMIMRAEFEAKVADLENRLQETINVANRGATANADAQSAIDAKSNESEQLKKEVASQKIQIEELHKALNESRNKETELLASIQQTEGSKAIATSEKDQHLQKLQGDLENAKHALQNQTEKAEGFRNAQQQLQEQCTAIVDQNKSYIERISTLEKELEIARNDMDRLVSEKNSSELGLRNEFQAAQEQLALAKNHTDQTKEQLSRELAEKDGRIGQLAAENASVREEATKITTELDKHKAQCQHLEATLAKLQESLAETQAKNERLQADLTTAVTTQNEAAGAALENAMKEYEMVSSKLRLVEEECNKLRFDQKQLQEENHHLQTDIGSMKSAQALASDEALKRTLAEKNQVITEVSTLKTRLDELETKTQTLEQERATLIQQNKNLADEITDTKANLNSSMDDAVKRLQSEKADLAIALESATTESMGLKSESEQWVSAKSIFEQTIDSMKEQMQTVQSKLGEHEALWRKEKELIESQMVQVQTRAQEADGKIRELNEQLRIRTQEMDEIRSAKTKVEEELAALGQENAALRQREQHAGDMDSLVNDLQAKIGSLSTRLKNETENRENQIQQLQQHAAVIQKLEREKSELLEKLAQAEIKLSELARLAVKSSTSQENNASAGGSSHENVDSDGQTRFLNSIIASQQKQIDELNQRVEILLHGGVEGLRVSNGLPKVPAPRKYCDICDKFDEHDTEDCPVQASNMDDEETHSHFHGKRGGDPRPYCDNCEVFGHSTDNCTEVDHETF